MNIPYYITCLCALLAVVLIGSFLVGMEFAGAVTGLPFHNYMSEPVLQFSFIDQPADIQQLFMGWYSLLHYGAMSFFMLFFGLIGYGYYDDWKHEPQKEMFLIDKSNFKGGNYGI